MPDGMGSTDDPSVLARQSSRDLFEAMVLEDDGAKRAELGQRWVAAVRAETRAARPYLLSELARVKADRRAWRIAAFGSLFATLLVAFGLTTSGVCS